MDENTALGLLIAIKGPVSLVLMRPGLEILPSSAHQTTNTTSLLDAPND